MRQNGVAWGQVDSDVLPALPTHFRDHTWIRIYPVAIVEVIMDLKSPTFLPSCDIYVEVNPLVAHC